MSRVRVKICGLRTVADVRAAVEAGADAVGFNFHPPSPRYVEPRLARELVRALPPFVDAVGVFVNETMARMRAIAAEVGLRSIQWVGDGSAPTEDAAPLSLVLACRVREASDLAAVRRAVAVGNVAAVLIDASVPGEYGGTGRAAPWELLAGFDPGVPLILAGGLTPENVADAVRIVRPYAVDVASGVESAAGEKDGGRMRAFVGAVGGANR